VTVIKLYQTRPVSALVRSRGAESIAAKAAEVGSIVAHQGFARGELELSAEEFSSVDWSEFASMWDRLPPDEFMVEGDDFRSRRFGRFTLDRGRLERALYKPYVERHNEYAGEMSFRAFPELEDAAYSDPVLLSLIRFDHSVISAALPSKTTWKVGVHLVRITCGIQSGQPTPEGVHQDDNTAFTVHLISRNCRGGKSRFYDLQRRLIAEFVLVAPLDSVFVDDSAVMHDVSPIEPVDSGVGLRDVAIVDFYTSQHAMFDLQ
jgi:hypothetical protein